MNAKKILLIVFVSILALAIGFGIWWAIANSEKIKKVADGTKIYTYEDLENAYQDGYSTAKVDQETYQDRINALKDQVGELQDEKKTLQDINRALQEDNTRLANWVLSLESATLSDNMALCSFSVNGNAYMALSVLKGTTISGVANPPSPDGYKFVGWEVDGRVVDLSTYLVTGNTTFTAKFDSRYVSLLDSSVTVGSSSNKNITDGPAYTYTLDVADLRTTDDFTVTLSGFSVARPSDKTVQGDADTQTVTYRSCNVEVKDDYTYETNIGIIDKVNISFECLENGKLIVHTNVELLSSADTEAFTHRCGVVSITISNIEVLRG